MIHQGGFDCGTFNTGSREAEQQGTGQGVENQTEGDGGLTGRPTVGAHPDDRDLAGDSLRLSMKCVLEDVIAKKCVVTREDFDASTAAMKTIDQPEAAAIRPRLQWTRWLRTRRRWPWTNPSRRATRSLTASWSLARTTSPRLVARCLIGSVSSGRRRDGAARRLAAKCGKVSSRYRSLCLPS